MTPEIFPDKVKQRDSWYFIVKNVKVTFLLSEIIIFSQPIPKLKLTPTFATVSSDFKFTLDDCVFFKKDLTPKPNVLFKINNQLKINKEYLNIDNDEDIVEFTLEKSKPKKVRFHFLLFFNFFYHNQNTNDNITTIKTQIIG